MTADLLARPGVLMRMIAGRMAAHGERPFLHAYAGSSGAIALCESPGFRLRRGIAAVIVVHADDI